MLRRNFITGLLCTPAIVRHRSLMRISSRILTANNDSHLYDNRISMVRQKTAEEIIRDVERMLNVVWDGNRIAPTFYVVPPV